LTFAEIMLVADVLSVVIYIYIYIYMLEYIHRRNCVSSWLRARIIQRCTVRKICRKKERIKGPLTFAEIMLVADVLSVVKYIYMC
jgi:hypothetical protein